MRKAKSFLGLALATFCLFSCGGNSPSSSATPTQFYDKTVGNQDFETPNEVVSSDFEIDGKLDNKEWDNASFTTTFGGVGECHAIVTSMIYWGDKGLTVGFYSVDKYVASSTYYSDPQFVINSDNVEFYIDTKNDKGALPKSDDYAFLINPEGYILSWHGTDLQWSHASGIVDFATSVDGTINNDSDVDGGWGTEIFIPYSSYGFNKDSTVSFALGTRDKTTNLLISEWNGWIPDPQVPDTYISMTKNGIITDSVNGYTVGAGKAEFADDHFVSKTANTILYKKDEFKKGTIKADVLAANGSDNGIIFGLDSECDLFFEGLGTSYYFFFINRDGNAFLGQTDNNVWKELSVVPSAAVKPTQANELKVILLGSFVVCYVNGVQVVSSPVTLSGYGYGYRFGEKDITAGVITKTSDTGDIKYDEIEGYNQVCGLFAEKGERYHSSTLGGAASILEKQNGNFTDGTMSITMNAGGAKADNGLVFMIDNKGRSSYFEDGVSYMFLFANKDGNLMLGRVDEGWTTVKEKAIVGWDATVDFTLSVIIDEDRVECRYNGDVMFTYYDGREEKGTGYGVRVGSSDATFDLPVIQ